mmetsp:Transcript_2234/g.4032  ORF Transcript_2234/g.4032 Transcript_2234/m.4032 type:complete len:217 (+) Transcript_2234:165-815(+)|eukprot:CAMPEP_0114429364 /NCGR_PEP_ID=MMETSP0103-20121206/9444_1 /TAXON_ID=37642 ORGANISM="Paraphysomonas imperforata, Strain PA2" /NCGR_SAMPLE_ID=MMETSP0103 /ASSEMBLY_ACC=CAM_ASM_000201 /LENGTH=216 /DNA_ID=CAMNT_0001598691 /DNA_START=78 /DNA_END=728 /DNA_ORIENTATION=+
MLSTTLLLLCMLSSWQPLHAGGGKRPSTIRSDLKALIRYTQLEINGFVDTCTTSAEYENVLLTLFPAVNILRLKHHPDIKIRTSGQTSVALLGRTDSPDQHNSKLDTVLSELGYSACPEFVRITDYAGYELEVLRGATATLKCTKIVCVSGNVMRKNSTFPFAADVISFMNDNNFAIYNTYENHRVRFFNVVIDMLFVKKEMMDEMYEVGYKDFIA